METRTSPAQKGKDFQIRLTWYAVRKSTLYSAAGAVGLLALVGISLYYALHYAPASTGANLGSPSIAEVRTAHFSSLAGNVKVRPAGTYEWLEANSRMPLSRGDLVRTASDSTAQITFLNNTVIEVKPDSIVLIEQSIEDPRTLRQSINVKVEGGQVGLVTPKWQHPESSMELSTRTVRARFREESEALSAYDRSSGMSTIDVYRGETSIRTPLGDAGAIGPNERLRVTSGGRLLPVEPLPATPVVLRPADQAILSFPDPAKSIVWLEWSPVEEAASYEFVVDDQVDFLSPTLSHRTRSARQGVQALKPGRYFWKVRAIDRQGLWGGFSDYASFVVSRQDSQACLLELEELFLHGRIAEVRGRAVPGSRLTINGGTYRIEPNGTFKAWVPLRYRGEVKIVVRTDCLNGTSNELRRTVRVESLG